MMEFITEFLQQFSSEETIQAYKADISSFKAYLDEKNILNMKNVSIQQLKRWQLTLTNTPSNRRKIACVKSLYKFLYNNNYIQENVGRVLKIPKQTPVKIPRQMSKATVNLFIATAEGKERLLVELLYYLGVRRDEIRKLKKRDISYSNRTLSFFVTGKGNKSRTVALSKAKTVAIKPIIDAINTTYIFRGRFGGPMSRSGLHLIVKRLATKINKPNISMHYFRQ